MLLQKHFYQLYHEFGVLNLTQFFENCSQLWGLQHCLKPQFEFVWQFEASKGDPPEQTCRAKKRGRLKARNHRDSDIQGVERWCSFPCKSTLWPSLFYTHSSIHSHIMDTHKETIFTGSEVVETGKQAEGRKKILLCKPFKDWAVVTANLIPNSSQHNLREKQPNTHWHDDSNGCDGIRTYCV